MTAKPVACAGGCGATFAGNRPMLTRIGWSIRWRRKLGEKFAEAEHVCPRCRSLEAAAKKPRKAAPKTAGELAQGRRDVAEDPDLGKHRDDYIARRHNVRLEVVREIREALGLTQPPKLPARVDWSKHRTP